MSTSPDVKKALEDLERIAGKPTAQAVKALDPKTATLHDYGQAIKGFDWSVIEQLLPILAVIYPPLAPLVPFITQALPIIKKILELFGLKDEDIPGATPTP